METSHAELKAEVEETSNRKVEYERKVKVLENQLAEANARLTDDEHQVAELSSVKTKLQKELEAALGQLEEVESRCSTAERGKALLESQMAEVQVSWMRVSGISSLQAKPCTLTDMVCSWMTKEPMIKNKRTPQP